MSFESLRDPYRYNEEAMLPTPSAATGPRANSIRTLSAELSDAVVATHTRGCAPTTAGRPPSEEAYALLWHGAPPARRNSAYVGLAVTVRSIRQVDSSREIVLMTINSSTPQPMSDSSLRELQDVFKPLSFVVLPNINVALFRKNCASALKRYTGQFASAAQSAESAGRKISHATQYMRRDRGRQQMQMFTKYGVFNLTRFSRLVYLDTDVLVTRALDDLWDMPLAPTEAIAAAATIASSRYKGEPRCRNFPRQFNAGVMLIRPSTLLYDVLINALRDERYPIHCFGDQNFLNSVFPKARAVCLRHRLKPGKRQCGSHEAIASISTKGADQFIRANVSPGAQVSCLGQSFNCRDSYMIHTTTSPTTAEYQRSRCNSADGKSPAPGFDRHPSTPYLPHILHFAVTDKPWAGEVNARRRTGRNATFFYEIWQRHYSALLQEDLVDQLPGDDGYGRLAAAHFNGSKVS